MRSPVGVFFLVALAAVLFAEPASAASRGKLVTGKHRCKFVEDGYKYNRICQVEKREDGTLVATAKGTELNPEVGFVAELSGRAPKYDVKAKMDSFATCRGEHTGKARLKKISKKDWFVLEFEKGCAIWIKAQKM